MPLNIDDSRTLLQMRSTLEDIEDALRRIADALEGRHEEKETSDGD